MTRKTRTRGGYEELTPLSDKEFIKHHLELREKKAKEQAEKEAWKLVNTAASEMAKQRELMQKEAAKIKRSKEAEAKRQEAAEREAAKQYAADMAAAARALERKYPLLEPLPEGGGRKSRRRGTRKGRRRKTKKDLRRRRH